MEVRSLHLQRNDEGWPQIPNSKLGLGVIVFPQSCFLPTDAEWLKDFYSLLHSWPDGAQER